MKYGHINFIRDDTGRISKVEWEGPPIIELSIRELVHMEAAGRSVVIGRNKMILGPYVLKKISGRPFGMNETYRRINGPLNIRLRSFLLSINYWLSLINNRILMTLRAWELLDSQIGCQYRWSDVRIYKWAKRLFG